MPPPAEGIASRLFLGPALRTQPDRRLVTLVREGYEAAFEEIVRRYGRPLGRYAASIVGGRSEDVLQDAFAKALPALRRDDAEIDLRPWLFRIVRNTALNDLRDSPPSPEALAETLAGGRNPAEELEAREQLADLMRRLQALPEAQRAAIVMRELEGLGHEEIAAALGLSDGGARQAIYRARRALRDGIGMLLPLPLLRFLIDHGSEAFGAGAGGALAAAGASAGGAGAGGALKAGVVAIVVAGSVGAGVAVQEHRAGDADTARASAAGQKPVPPAGSSPTTEAGLALAAQRVEDSRSGDDRHGAKDGGPGSSDRGGPDAEGGSRGRHGGRRPPHRDGRHRGEHRGGRHGARPEDDFGEHARAPRPERGSDHSGPGRRGEDEGALDDRDGDHSGPGGGGDDSGELRSGSGPGPGDDSPPPPEEKESPESNEGPGGDDRHRDLAD